MNEQFPSNENNKVENEGGVEDSISVKEKTKKLLEVVEDFINKGDYKTAGEITEQIKTMLEKDLEENPEESSE